MIRKFCTILSLVLVTCIAFSQQKEVRVKMETTLGTIELKLYNETPKHRDNFLKLIKENTYDSLLFHRVIKDFMIQGGDPQSKNAPADKMLGEGDLGYKIDAEFLPTLFHKKGALAAAREGDDVNPAKQSSACQFYIVQGRIFTNDDLTKFEEMTNKMRSQNYLRTFLQKPANEKLVNKLNEYRKNNKDSFNILYNQVKIAADNDRKNTPLFKFSDEQRKAYTTIGGTPHLDGGYTVFGEVVSGLDIVDKIAAVKTDSNDRPLENIRILSIKVQE